MDPIRTTDGGSADSASSFEKIKHPILHSLGEWTRVIVIAVLISLPIRFFIAEPFVVNGASMDPTFSTGQFLIVDRLTYRFASPSRGDVVVFAYPNNPRVYYIKRIIGLPGETLTVNDGFVSILSGDNHASSTLSLEEPYITNSHRSHDNIAVSLGPTEYFVMGDNRTQSSDSRVWGPLDRDLIVGRPLLRLLPFENIDLLPGKYHDKNNSR